MYSPTYILHVISGQNVILRNVNLCSTNLQTNSSLINSRSMNYHCFASLFENENISINNSEFLIGGRHSSNVINFTSIDFMISSTASLSSERFRKP